jgi:hypothetical protein
MTFPVASTMSTAFSDQQLSKALHFTSLPLLYRASGNDAGQAVTLFCMQPIVAPELSRMEML